MYPSKKNVTGHSFLKNIHSGKNFTYISRVKGKAIPLQAWTGPEGSRKLRLPDFVATAQDGGGLSALLLLLIYVRDWVDPRAIVRSEGFYVNEKSTDTSLDRTSDLSICNTEPQPLCYRGPPYFTCGVIKSPSVDGASGSYWLAREPLCWIGIHLAF